jgi:hypothetical protein
VAESATNSQPHPDQPLKAAAAPGRREIAEAIRDLRFVASAPVEGYSVRTNRHVAGRIRVRSPGAHRRTYIRLVPPYACRGRPPLATASSFSPPAMQPAFSVPCSCWPRKGAPAVPEDAEVVVTVGFGPRSENGLGLEIALDITLPGVARKEAQA